MSFRIIGDSCTDLTDELKQDENVSLAPLYIHIGEHTVIDDATFDQADFLKRVSEYPEAAKSSCPSPQAYMDLFDEKKDNYVITLSSQLSGSYNSAELAKKQFHEDYPNTNIEVFDSKSASVGQTLIARKIKEHALQGDTFHEVVEKVNAYRDAMTTKFVLESLETLRKNGRLSNIKAIICSALNIKPIMTSTDEGEIDKLDQARGIDRKSVV